MQESGINELEAKAWLGGGLWKQLKFDHINIYYIRTNQNPC